MKDDEGQTKGWRNIVSRFRGKLVKMIRDAGSKFDDYSISPKIRQILLHWGYELTGKDFFNELTNERIKVSYYWCKRQEILQNAKARCSKERSTVLFEKQRSYKRKVERAL